MPRSTASLVQSANTHNLVTNPSSTSTAKDPTILRRATPGTVRYLLCPRGSNLQHLQGRYKRLPVEALYQTVSSEARRENKLVEVALFICWDLM